MNRNILTTVTTLFLLITGACKKNDMIGSISDDRLLNFAYDKDYQFPEGFFHEGNLIGSVYYENTVSVRPMNERENIWIELNTNDKEQAKTWSNLSNVFGSIDRSIVKENETEKYFEFVRVNIQNGNDILLSRVHRIDYFVSLRNKFADIDKIGIYNGELTTDKVKELIEYLWSCGTLGLYDKVVESKISNSENGFEYNIQSLRTVFGDFGLHDMIYVYDNIFHLDKSTRILTVSRKQIKEIEGNYHEGW